MTLAEVATQAQPLVPAPGAPSAIPGLDYDKEYFPGASHRPGIATIESLLGFAHGERAATPEEIERCLTAWTSAAPDRTRLVEYARSHAGRPLHYVVVSSPASIARLDEIQRGFDRLADPRGLSTRDAATLIDSLPAVAWLSYAIHGSETEGADAALAVLHHLIAADDADTAKLLEAAVVIIDPCMNPDGRARFLKMIAEHRGATRGLDDQALLHTGYWPFGRGNHYLFDLNRDYLTLTQPETLGRAREIARWNPQLFVDAHCMHPQDTHLLSPPREPVNANMPARQRRWWDVFLRDHAAAFDRAGFVYYTGEWNDGWFPGYTDSWANLRGAVGILYEQAAVSVDGVRRHDGRIMSYRESVHHHVLGSMTNLATFAREAKALRRDFFETRVEACDAAGPYGKRTFVVLPTANRGRLDDFVRLINLQGIEAYEAASEFTAASARDQLGRELKDTKVPVGAIVIPNRQPLAHLVAALLEFDPRPSERALIEERQEVLRTGESLSYDVTTWNLTMMWGLEALELPQDLRVDGMQRARASERAVAPAQVVSSEIGYVFDGADDRSVGAAARLMERGVRVRVAEKPFEFASAKFARGSVVADARANRALGDAFASIVQETAAILGVSPQALKTALGEGDLPDLGGAYFHLLERPRIGVFGRDVSETSFGSVWFTLDQRLGIRTSAIEPRSAGDLGRYNVLVVPDGGLARADEDFDNALAEWVRNGGTLIAIGGAAERLIEPKAGLSKVRALPDVLDDLSAHELAVIREWASRTASIPAHDSIWANQPPAGLSYPWQNGGEDQPDEEERKRRDDWQALFMPRGALLAGRVDEKHWLTAGCGEYLPVFAGAQSPLMAAGGVEAPIRFGHLVATEREETSVATETAEKTTARIGWSVLPEGTEMYLRMSGLLWPEGAHRLANSAYVTRESVGRGQIILFAMSPTFRASARGAERVFLNAVVYGPGMGATHSIRP